MMKSWWRSQKAAGRESAGGGAASRQAAGGEATAHRATNKTARGKKKKTPTRREMLALRPLRNPALEWAEENGQVVLHIKRGQGTRAKWTLRLLSIFVPLPENHRVALDPIGTHVWRMLDGQTTVERIIKSLAREYKITPREAELSLQQFFKELSRRGYVGFLKE